MEGLIKDNVAIEFALGFYDALAAGRTIDDAFEFGRNGILTKFPKESKHLIPVLKRRKDIDNQNCETVVNIQHRKTRFEIPANAKTFGGSEFQNNEMLTLYGKEHTPMPQSQSPSIYKAVLKAHNGKYVAAAGGGGGKLVAISDWMNEWEIFNIEELPGEKITLRVHNGQYVKAIGGGGRELIAESSSPETFEIFATISLGNNRIALQAHNGDYVSVKEGGNYELVATRPKIRAWEIFTLTKLGPARGES
jgi:hypothetical protein